MKPDDLIGAWACSACHDEIDRRTHNLDNKDARLYHLEGVIRTQAILLKEGRLSHERISVCASLPAVGEHLLATTGNQYYISDKARIPKRRSANHPPTQVRIFTKSRLRIKVIADVPDSRRRDLVQHPERFTRLPYPRRICEDDEQFDDIRVIRGVKVPGGRLGIKITELENV